MTMMCLQRPNLTTHPGTAAVAENRFPGMSVCFVLGFACLARVLERKVIRVVSVRSVKRISALSVLRVCDSWDALGPQGFSNGTVIASLTNQKIEIASENGHARVRELIENGVGHVLTVVGRGKEC